MFTFKSSIHNHAFWADSNHIHIPSHRSKVVNRSFIVTAARLWKNSLPSFARSSSSSLTFNRGLLAYLNGGGFREGWSLFLVFNPPPPPTFPLAVLSHTVLSHTVFFSSFRLCLVFFYSVLFYFIQCEAWGKFVIHFYCSCEANCLRAM